MLDNAIARLVDKVPECVRSGATTVLAELKTSEGFMETDIEWHAGRVGVLGLREVDCPKGHLAPEDGGHDGRQRIADYG